MTRGKKTPPHISAFILKQAGRVPRPTNKEISAQVFTRFHESASPRTIARICRAESLPTKSVDVGSTITAGDRRRARRLLAEMWIPDPEIVGSELVGVSEGSNASRISGRDFFWSTVLMADTRGRRRSEVSRCWHALDDENWLLNALMEKVVPETADQLRETYETLQVRACRLISGIRSWNAARETLNDRGRIRDYSDLRISGTGFRESDELAKEALFLVDETPALRGAMADFVPRFLGAINA